MSRLRLSHSNSKRAFTLVETLLALTISGLIGFSALLMLSGLSSASIAERETRRSLLRRQLSIFRIATEMRAAALALAATDTQVLLWKGDTTGNGLPDLSELRLIVWSYDSGDVVVYETTATAADMSYDFDVDLLAAVAPLVGTDQFPGRLTLQDVSSWALAFDAADVREARRLRIAATIGGDEIVVIASFRAAGGTAS